MKPASSSTYNPRRAGPVSGGYKEQRRYTLPSDQDETTLLYQQLSSLSSASRQGRERTFPKDCPGIEREEKYVGGIGAKRAVRRREKSRREKNRMIGRREIYIPSSSIGQMPVASAFCIYRSIYMRALRDRVGIYVS